MVSPKKSILSLRFFSLSSSLCKFCILRFNSFIRDDCTLMVSNFSRNKLFCSFMLSSNVFLKVYILSFFTSLNFSQFPDLSTSSSNWPSMVVGYCFSSWDTSVVLRVRDCVRSCCSVSLCAVANKEKKAVKPIINNFRVIFRFIFFNFLCKNTIFSLIKYLLVYY